jgi:hypothetical protein
MECEYCKLVLKSNYILKAHLKNSKACLKLRGLEMNSKFTCQDCNLSFISNINLNIHFESCKRYIRRICQEELELKLQTKEKENNDLILQYKKENNDLILQHNKETDNLILQHKKEINSLTISNNEKVKDLQAQLDKMFSTIEKLASQAIDKPNTTITTNVNNIYSDKYFLEDIKPEDVKRKCQTHLTEQIFFAGQRGIAQLCTDHIIKTKDNKVLLSCSDVSRKKFKYVDDVGNMKEDYEARTFTKKVYEPIKKASQIVYENILSDIKEQEEKEDDSNKKSDLNDKTLKAIDCFVQIANIDNPNGNSEFKNELAILNK